MVLEIRSPEFRLDPYPAFARMRAEAPVCRIAPHGHWAVARYADVLAVLRNPRLFSSTGIGEEPAPGTELAQARAMIGSDPPQHTRLRGLVAKAFTPGRVSALEPRIREVAKNLIREILPLESFDLVAEFSMPLPVIVIAELLGIDPARRGDFKRWTDTLLTWRSAALVADESRRLAREREIADDMREMLDYFHSMIAERGRAPRSDLISALVLACENEQRLSLQEVLSFVRLLLVAGNETTTNLIGNAVLALLANPQEAERVRRARSLVPNLVEESLRFSSPVLSLARRTTADTEIAGVRIAKGEIVLPLLASANHDETKFAEPWRFDVGRDARGHLAFGEGIHFCLGSPLARLQVRIAFEEIFGAFPALEREGSGPLEYLDSFFFRGVRSLRLNASPA